MLFKIIKNSYILTFNKLIFMNKIFLIINYNLKQQEFIFLLKDNFITFQMIYNLPYFQCKPWLLFQFNSRTVVFLDFNLVF